MRKTILLLLSILIYLVAGAQPARQWKGHWITATENKEEPRAPLLRRAFAINKPLASATLYACGLGYPVTTLNGKPMTDAVLDQAFTRYDKTLLYQSYNVKHLLHFGTNVIGTELGNGWYNQQSHTIWFFDHIAWRKSPRLILDLVLTYQDGTCDTIGTDEQWKTNFGASQFNSLPAGEIYDARKAIPGWNQPGFNDQNWQAAHLTTAPGGSLQAQQMPPVKIIRILKPVAIHRLAANRFVYDFGENFAGVTRMTIQGKAGDTVTLHYSETLNPDGSVDRKQNAGQMIGPPSEPKFATDQYILKGQGTETYTPRFTYHGFRYVEVESKTQPNLSGLFYSTGFKPAGTFSSSDPMLNKLYAAAIRSYRSNYMGIPTDCPQREKMGWLADAWVCADLGLWNFDTKSSYQKYLGDIRDVQLPNGSMPGIAPTNGIGYRWIDPADPDFGPCWGSASTQITASLYHHTGDTAIVAENYPANKGYIEFALKKMSATGNLYQTGMADFLAIGTTPKAITSTALIYQDARLLAEMALAIGKPGDAANYLDAADSIRTAFNRVYFDPIKHNYQFTTLTALAMALECGLCPDNAKTTVAAQLAATVRAKNYRADFGLLGTKFVLRALSNNGYPNEAYRLLTNTEAGWGKWIKQGATTLWEGWEPKDQSYNHVFFGDFAAWYFAALGGLKTTDGFRHFSVKPVFPAGLHQVAVSHQTAFGEIRIRWQQTPKEVQVTLRVPKGTTADVELPGIRRTCPGGHYQFTTKTS